MNRYERHNPYLAPKGRWGDALPKLVPVREPMEKDGLGPAYDPITGKSMSVVRWYTRTELYLDAGYTPKEIRRGAHDEDIEHLIQQNTPEGKPVTGGLDWEGGINAPDPKVTATDPRKNKSPRSEPEDWTRKPVSSCEAYEIYGPAIFSDLKHEDGSVNLERLDMIMDVQLEARWDRLKRFF